MAPCPDHPPTHQARARNTCVLKRVETEQEALRGESMWRLILFTFGICFSAVQTLHAEQYILNIVLAGNGYFRQEIFTFLKLPIVSICDTPFISALLTPLDYDERKDGQLVG